MRLNYFLQYLQSFQWFKLVFWGFSRRVTENEGVNKMSLHNLATVFGPTLLRPSEKDSKILNSSQPISMNDSWSLEVMAQVRHLNALVETGTLDVGLIAVFL